MSTDNAITFNVPFKLTEEFEDIQLEYSSAKSCNPVAVRAALDAWNFSLKFITCYETGDEIQTFEPETPFEPGTEATSDIKPGMMFTGFWDPTDPP